MPPTVRSLDERIDGMASDLEGLSHQIAANQNATENQLALMGAKLDAVIDQLKATNARLDKTIDKLDALNTDHTAVKTRQEMTENRVQDTAIKVDAIMVEFGEFRTTMRLMRWIGGFAAAALVTVIIMAFAVARSIGHMDATLEVHSKTLDEIKRDVIEIRNKQK